MAKVGAKDQSQIGIAVKRSAKAPPVPAVWHFGLKKERPIEKFSDVKRSSGAFKGVRRES